MDFLDSCPAGGLTDLPHDAGDLLTGRFEVLAAQAGTQVVLGNDRIVLKLFKTPAQTAAQFAAWGKDLGNDPDATHPGDDLRSAEGKLRLAFEATALAWQSLRSDSALVGVHLAPTSLGLTCVTPFGTLELDTVPFVVQLRAVEARTVIDARMAAGAPAEAFAVLRDWLDFTTLLHRRDLTGHRNFDENYGYVGGRMVLLDVGDLRRGRDRVEWVERTQHWLSAPAMDKLRQRHPKLAEDFERESRRRFGVPVQERPSERWRPRESRRHRPPEGRAR